MLTGSMVALVTPMDALGAVDWQAFERLVKRQLDAGTDALIINGTTAETATLTQEERQQALQLAISISSRQVPVIAGTGSNSTQASIDASKAAKAMGADATLLVCPYYNKPTQDGLYYHFKSIATAVDMPHILYNVPSRTVVDLDDETTLRLAAVDNIVGIKDATADMQRCRTLVEAAPKQFTLLSGDDLTAVEFLEIGGHGFISVTANVAPVEMKQLYDAATQGRMDDAMALQKRLMPLHQKLFCESNPIPVKWALERMGLIQGGIRLPLTPLSSQHHSELSQALTDTGMLS